MINKWWYGDRNFVINLFLASMHSKHPHRSCKGFNSSQEREWGKESTTYSQQKYDVYVASYNTEICDDFVSWPMNTFLVLLVTGGMKNSNNTAKQIRHAGQTNTDISSKFFCKLHYVVFVIYILQL